MIHIVRGLPGDGKSTFAHSKRFGGALVLENDQYWITGKGEYAFPSEAEYKTRYPLCQEYVMKMLREALSLGVTVVLPSVYMSEASIEKIVAIANEFGSEFEIWNLHVLEGTNTQFRTSHAVPEKVMKIMADNFAHELKYPQHMVTFVPPSKCVDGNVYSYTTRPGRESTDG